MTDAIPPTAPSATASRPSVRDQLRAWLAIGIQSVGGGASTLFLMRRILIRQRGWVDEAAFTQDWTLSKASPGMTLIALTALLGWRVGGRRGIPIALAGLLVPATLITIVLAAGFVLIRDLPEVGAALDGMAPATIGMTLAMMVIFVRSSVRAGRLMVVDLLVVVAAVIAGTIALEASVLIIVVAALIGWLILGQEAPIQPDPDHDPGVE